MPLSKETRTEVVDYVLRDLAPVKPPPRVPLEWFKRQFAFILESELKARLGEAFYQARLMEKLREALGLKHGFNHAFVHFQILQYASIYEAVIDYRLEQCRHLPVVSALIHYENLTQVKEAFGQATQLLYSDVAGQHVLVPCRKKVGIQQLKEVQFSKRLRAAVKIGLVPKEHEDFIDRLYGSRNCLHLINATAKDYEPLVEISKNAFMSMRSFLNHVKSWIPPSTKC